MTSIRQELRSIILSQREYQPLITDQPLATVATPDEAAALMLARLDHLDAWVQRPGRTSSRYVKFGDRRLGVVRISNHPEGSMRRYDWSLIFGLNKAYSVIDRGARRYYYPAKDALSLCKRIEQEAQRFTHKHRG